MEYRGDALTLILLPGSINVMFEGCNCENYFKGLTFVNSRKRATFLIVRPEEYKESWPYKDDSRNLYKTEITFKLCI